MSGKYDQDNPTHRGSNKPYHLYNPNDLILISKEEIDRQAKEALETMKQNSDFHEENIKANQWRGEL